MPIRWRFFVPLVLTLAACLCVAGGCASSAPQPDWQAARHVLADSRDVAEGFRPVAQLRDREEQLDQILDLIDHAAEVVDLQLAAGGSMGDDSQAVQAVRLLLDVAGEVIAEWPEPTERAVASATYAAVRVALRSAHRWIAADE